MRLLTFFGIPIRLHWLFLVLVVLVLLRNGMAAGSAAAFSALTLMGILFGSVVLHELGHALTARRFGARIVDITLWPLGGLTRMTHMPEKPVPELCVALAGPAVNALLLGLGVLAGGTALLPWARSDSPIVVEPRLIDIFTSVNFALAAFNLAPAFPMDGGRALRAALSAPYGYLRATEIAVRIGRWFAVIAVVAAWYQGEILIPILLIAVFLWIQGAQELADVRMRHGIDPLRTVLRRMFGMEKDATSRDDGQHPPTPPSQESTPSPSSSSSQISKELESYRGSMEEYFRARDAEKRGPS
jgi:Zn-dependent protease